MAGGKGERTVRPRPRNGETINDRAGAGSDCTCRNCVGEAIVHAVLGRLDGLRCYVRRLLRMHVHLPTGRSLSLLCGSTNVPHECALLCSHPVGRPRRDVPFLTGQKGDGKSRRAVRAAADSPAPRRGRESQGPEGSSRGLARTSAMASLRHRFAKSPSASQRRPRRRTAKGPGEGGGERRRKKQASGTVLFLFCFEKGVDWEKSSTRDGHDTSVLRLLTHRAPQDSGPCTQDGLSGWIERFYGRPSHRVSPPPSVPTTRSATPLPSRSAKRGALRRGAGRTTESGAAKAGLCALPVLRTRRSPSA